MATLEDRLWDFILMQVWISVVCYVGVVVIAAARDITMKNLAKFRRDSAPPLFSRSHVYHSIATWYSGSTTFFVVEWIRLITNLVVCVIYVYTTYLRRVPAGIAVVNRVFAALFTFDLILGALIASSSMLYFLQFARFLQIVAIPSLFWAIGPSAFLHFGFLRAFSAYDAYIRMERRVIQLQFATKKYAFRLFFQCLTLFYVLAGGIQMLEIPGDWRSLAFLDSFGSDWTFFNSIYWVIVTLSTVGFGDMSPATIQGRLYTIFIIIIGIIVFSNVIQDLFKEMRRQRGNGSYRDNFNIRHVIVSGTPNLADLVHFVKEFYNRRFNRVAHIVVLVEDPKWTDTDWFKYVARNHFLQHNVHYLVGSVLSTVDLQRAGINTADAVFILTSPALSGEASAQDTQVVMSALAIRNSRTDIPIYSQTLLEDSNMQIGAAMRTPASRSNSRLLFRDGLGSDAQYCGIYESIQRLEAEVLPASLKTEDPEQSCSDTERSKEHNDESKDRVCGSKEYGRDLKRSSNLCLQQVFSSLLVANIKANGVGTLLTNLYLDLPAVQSGLPWMSEYALGAACNLHYAIVPPALDGVIVKDIASLLFRRGVVVVATHAKRDLVISTVRCTKQPLKAGELVLCMTFLAKQHLALALRLVGIEYERSESFTLCHNFKQQREKSQSELTPSPRRLQNRRMSLSAGMDVIGSQSHGLAQRTSANTRDARRPPHLSVDGSSLRPSPLSTRSRRPPLGPSPRGLMLAESRESLGSRSLDHMTLVPASSADMTSSAADTLDYSVFENVMGALNKSRSSIHIPRDLKNHVIVAMEGKTPLANLPFFLRLFWLKSRPSQEMRPQVPVVVIHPELPADVRESFENDERYARLFFVNGSPASRSAWERARLQDARAVATMADYTQEWRVSDARTIYTLLTLDALTTVQQNLFICSELIDEHSLEFLREPFNPRRRGARLGNPLIQHTTSEHVPPAPDPVAWSENDEDHTTEFGASAPGPEVREDAAYSGDQWGSAFSGSSLSATSAEERLATNALFSGKEAEDDDSSSLPGLSRPAREYLFSRVRYISGELLVHSTADTLLVREYAEPGFARFLSTLLGAEPTDPGQKIRLVRIPKGVFREYREVNGKRLIEFGVVFERLVALGVTPLGLYRSGDAPVRIPKLKRIMRGEALLREATLLEVASAVDKTSRTNGVGPIRKIVQEGQQVLPTHVRNQRGQKQFLGAYSPDARGSATPTNATEYGEETVEGNLLPYVYTLPDPNTLVAETDGVYILCDAAFELPRIWPRSSSKVISDPVPESEPEPVPAADQAQVNEGQVGAEVGEE